MRRLLIEALGEVSYVLGPLTASPHKAAVDSRLRYLATEAAQSAYERFGFVRAQPDEFRLRRIP